PVLGPLAQLAREARSSATDHLTQLPNRRAFAEVGAAELARARRSQRPLAIAIVDVDDFKHINDTYGHAVGDHVLRGVADVLRAEFREIDVAARHGGEEFAVLLPETDLTGAQEAAERFIVALAGHEFGDGRTIPHGITASAGVASGIDTPIDELLDAADRALYRAKERGKNQVQVAAPTI
ncbi:MAG TPA: GGDEF domain-containing protein, partial [Gaiellaceae bacterium]|nr:GGDEF domain-containing protein [Gaiellaceae bacterium]